VIFEYGYLSSRLTRRRVAICRFGEADMPSDLEGVKIIKCSEADYQAPELPQHIKREIISWLDRLPRLAAGFSPIAQSHGYSGRWSIENRFDRWRGLPVEDPDAIYFNGTAILSIPPNGRGGTGIMYGHTFISVQEYNARLDVVNEIRDATVDDDGGLRLRIQVVRRHRGKEEGDPPGRQFRESMEAQGFEVSLHPVAGMPNELHGQHRFVFLLVTRLAAWSRLRLGEEFWKDAEMLLSHSSRFCDASPGRGRSRPGGPGARRGAGQRVPARPES
jgi:hypothetical protein